MFNHDLMLLSPDVLTFVTPVVSFSHQFLGHHLNYKKKRLTRHSRSYKVSERIRDMLKQILSATLAPFLLHGFPEHAMAMTVNSTGFDGVRYGMSLQEGSSALGEEIRVMENPGYDDNCSYAVAENMAPGAQFMIIKGSIMRIDVLENSNIRTAEGAGIGSSESDLMRIYGDSIVKQDNPYRGYDMTYTETISPGVVSKIVFSTDGRTVQVYRAGIVPAVDYIEGCS